MTIQFKCDRCGKTLQVGDNAAGKRAKCPKCDNVVLIPSAPQPTMSGPSSGPPTPPPPPESKPKHEADEWDQLTSSSFTKDTANPYRSPEASLGLPKISLKDYQSTGGAIRNVPADVGSIMNYSVAVWKENLGLLIGASIVIALISGTFGGMGNFMGTFAHRAGLRAVAVFLPILFTGCQMLVNTFLSVGLTQMILKMARRQRTEFADLFGGGEMFVPALGINILFGLATAVGFALCFVPGVIVALLWWPAPLLVIDKKAPVMESFAMARTITANNIGTVIVLWLIGFGVVLLGLAACCVGVIFAGPLVAVMHGVAYLMMSGQIPVNAQVSK